MARRIFDELVKIDGVIGGLLVSKDGLVVQSLMIEEEDADVLGAMAANTFDNIARTTERLGIGRLNDSIIGAKEGTLLVREAGELVLVVICQQPVNIGEVRLAMSRAARNADREFGL
ncbi:MAG: roadblock/LC7 domain-containing protein [Chloroflexota bacterium]|nr:roadblock/LC7 domain-containing protein [Chloroflexota bacterium]